MRYALIDNSTLTAIQRLLGGIPIKNKAIIDTDILAFENYIETILFFDEIICIDDYKNKFRMSRKKYFGNIRFVDRSLFDYDAYINKSIEIANSISPKIESGEIRDEDFSLYLGNLKMHMVFTWDLSSSIYYLTQKMLQYEAGLGLEKFSELSAAIFHDVSVKRNLATKTKKNEFKIIDSGKIVGPSGHVVTDNRGKETEARLSKQLLLFLAGLNWLAQRTIFYALIAEYLCADIVLHPIRQPFNVNVLMKLYNTPAGKLKPLVDAMNDIANEGIGKIKGLTEPYVLAHKTPIFLVYLIKQTKDPLKITEAAYDLKEQEEFVQARVKLRELNLLIEEGNNSKFVEEGNVLVGQINKEMEKLIVKYGVGANQGIAIGKVFSFWNGLSGVLNVPKLPIINTKIRRLEFLKHIIPVKGFKGVFRSLIKDLTAIARIGKYHELLSSRILLDEEAEFYEAKTEDPKLRNFKSGWKIPMN